MIRIYYKNKFIFLIIGQLINIKNPISANKAPDAPTAYVFRSIWKKNPSATNNNPATIPEIM